MLRPGPLLTAFERAQQAQNRAGFHENLRLVEALYEEARALGVFPPADPLDGIETDIGLAKALHVLPSA